MNRAFKYVLDRCLIVKELAQKYLGRGYPRAGLIPQEIDDRDLVYKASGAIKSLVDLRYCFPKICDQSWTNSCTAMAVGDLLDYYFRHKRKVNPWTSESVSKWYIWYYSRKEEGTQTKNNGVILRNVFKYINNNGFALKEFWPESKSIYAEPDEKARLVASFFVKYLGTLPKYYAIISNKSQNVKNCLSNGLPVVFGFPWQKEMYQLDAENPYYNEITNWKNVGYHAMLVVGFTDEYFIIRNSYGRTFGEKGYFYLHQDLFDLHAIDIWTLKD